MHEALAFMAARGLDLVITSGGLGPTADDLTAEVVGGFQEREMKLDPAVEERIAEILRPLAKRFPDIDMEAVRAGNRKQAMVPEGATVLDPVGTAPGARWCRRRTAGGSGPTVWSCPGPPRELQPMWATAVATEALKAALTSAGQVEQRMLRLFGIPESEIAETLRVAEREGVELDRLEITTCLKRGEVEVVTRVRARPTEGVYRNSKTSWPDRHPDTLFSTDGRTVDQQVAALLRDGSPERAADGGHRRVVHRRAAGRPPDRAAGLLGLLQGRDRGLRERRQGSPGRGRPGLIEAYGAVSCEVARGARRGRLRASRGRFRGRHHGDRRSRWGHRGEARRAGVAERGAGRTGRRGAAGSG